MDHLPNTGTIPNAVTTKVPIGKHLCANASTKQLLSRLFIACLCWGLIIDHIQPTAHTRYSPLSFSFSV